MDGEQDRPADGGKPLASVIIPTRNRSRLLREAVEALARQTLDPTRFEVIVVDNRSTDDTLEIMRDLQKRMPFRILFHVMPKNRGPACSRNTGANMARGPILAFTDSDCRPTPNWLASGIAAFEDRVLAFASGKVLYKPEQILKTNFFARESGEVLKEHPTYTWTNVFYRRDVFKELGGTDESLCMPDFRNRVVDCGDTDLAWRAKERGYRNTFLPDALVYHERDVLRPVDWIWEPFRLFVLGALVKRHPQLRRELLHFRLFFMPSNIALYLLLVGGVLGIALHTAWLALCLPFLAWAAFLMRNNFTGRERPALAVAVPKTAVQIALLTLRHFVLGIGLVYGSLRFRTLVL